MNITAIIVNYHTSSFLPPLLKTLNSDPLISKIIVADNSAEAGLGEMLSGFFKARLMVSPENIGFAAAVNRAVENCNSDWFLLINPDTLPDKGFLEKLIKGAKQSDALIAGPRQYWDNEKTFRLPPALGNSWWVQMGMEAANAFELDARLLGFNWGLRFDRFWKEEGPFYEPFLSGACLLIKNDKFFFRDGKIFDERFFLYYEDTDLCVKAMMANRNMVCVPDAQIVHYWNQSPSLQKDGFMAESHRLFMEKYYKKNNTINLPGVRNIVDFPEDLGKVSKSPRFFSGQMHGAGKLYFEIGLTPIFIPFAQASCINTHFEIPGDIWDKMQPGLYFGRIRNSLNKIIAKWKWRKQ